MKCRAAVVAGDSEMGVKTVWVGGCEMSWGSGGRGQ